MGIGSFDMKLERNKIENKEKRNKTKFNFMGYFGLEMRWCLLKSRLGYLVVGVALLKNHIFCNATKL